MSAVLLEDVIEKDKALLNGAILDEEIAFRERIIQIKTFTFKKRMRLEEKRRLKGDKKVHKQLYQKRLNDIFKISNKVVFRDHGPDDEVTKKIFDERCDLLRMKSDTVDIEIKNCQENCDRLTESFRNACKVLFHLNRLEIVCTKMDLWVEGLKETSTGVENSPHLQEEIIADHIRGLLSKRDEDLGRIEVLKKKISTASESLKYAMTKPNDDFTENGDNERRICTAENDVTEDNAHSLITNAIKTANEKLVLLRRKNNELNSKIKTTKASNKRNSDKLELEKAREERGILTNTRAIAELNKENAFITSNIECLMQQLNFEHYGLGGGPSTLQATQQKQLAISERRIALIEQRAKSKEVSLSPPKDEVSSVKRIVYSASEEMASPKPENLRSTHE